MREVPVLLKTNPESQSRFNSKVKVGIKRKYKEVVQTNKNKLGNYHKGEGELNGSSIGLVPSTPLPAVTINTM